MLRTYVHRYPSRILNSPPSRIDSSFDRDRDLRLGDIMEENLIHLMLNGGANIAFGLFLYMQNKELQKRADDREAKQDQKEQDLRDRYDKVIADMQLREDTIRRELVSEINDLERKVTTLETKIEHIFKIVDEIKARFVAVR